MDEHVCMPLFVATHRSQVCLRLKDITMSLNEPVRLKSQSKRKRLESERTAKNKRHKSKRAASPTSSYLSMRTDWSIDPPTNFKDGETSPLHSRIKRKRETSPVTSYISLKSDNPMNISKCNTSDLRERAASPTCISMKTDWSIDPPPNFKAAETFPLDPRLLTEQHLRCPVCKLMLKNPVSIPCGHNYCNGCINAFWDNCAGEYVCPHCGKASETRPVLSINAALAEVVKNMQQASFSPALPPQSYAGPEDVACDFCIERRLKSVKFCSNCDASICETHVRQHYTIPALQKHILSDVTGDIKEGQNSNSSLNSTASGQQHHTDKTQDIIKEIAVAAKLQTRLKRSAKTFRPKTKEKKDVRSIELMCSTLQQEVSVLKEKLSKLETKNTKKEKSEDEDDYGEEYDKEEDSEEDDDVYGEEYDKEEDSEEDDNVYGEEYEEQVVEEDYGEEDEEEYEEDDYGEEEEKYGEDYSEKDFDAESDEEDEGDEDSFDDEDRYKDDYDGLEDYWKETGDEEDYDDENNSEEDSDEDYYKDY